MILGLHHVHIICGDVEKTADYFQDVLGAEELHRGILGGNAFIRLGLKGLIINMTQTNSEAGFLEPGRGKRGLDHISFQINDIESVVGHLQRKGVKIVRGPAVSETGSQYIFIEGPEGLLIELMKPKMA